MSSIFRTRIILNLVLCGIVQLSQALMIEPLYREVTEGRTVTFICHVTQRDRLVIFKYGTVTPCVLMANGDVFEKSPGFSCGVQGPSSYYITIDQTNRTHRATDWRCQRGNDISENAVLIINYAPSVILTGNGEQSKYVAHQGDDVNFRCQVDASPKEIVVIRGPESELTRQRNASIASAMIPDAQCIDTGNYFCEANNALGSGTTSLQLFVKCAPERPRNYQDVFYAAENGEVTLTLIVNAYPRPTFTWRRPTGEIIQLSNGSFTRGVVYTDSIHLPSVDSRDMGYYSVVVENEIGERNFTLLLQVKDGVNNGFLVGVVVGGVILGIFVVMFVCFIMKKLRGLRSDKEEDMDLDPLSEGTYKEEKDRPADVYTEVRKPGKSKEIEIIEEPQEGQKEGVDENGLTYVGVDFEDAPDNDVTTRDPPTQYAVVDINQTTPLYDNSETERDN